MEVIVISVAVLMTTASSSAWMRKSLNRMQKQDAIKTALSSVGIKNFSPKEWNTLDNNGLTSLCTVITVINQAKNPFMMGMGGGMDMSKFIPKDVRTLYGGQPPTTGQPTP